MASGGYVSKRYGDAWHTLVDSDPFNKKPLLVGSGSLCFDDNGC